MLPWPLATFSLNVNTRSLVSGTFVEPSSGAIPVTLRASNFRSSNRSTLVSPPSTAGRRAERGWNRLLRTPLNEAVVGRRRYDIRDSREAKGIECFLPTSGVMNSVDEPVTRVWCESNEDCVSVP